MLSRRRPGPLADGAVVYRVQKLRSTGGDPVAIAADGHAREWAGGRRWLDGTAGTAGRVLCAYLRTGRRSPFLCSRWIRPVFCLTTRRRGCVAKSWCDRAITNYMSLTKPFRLALAACALSLAAAAPMASPFNRTFCCGVGSAAPCGGPDWTPLTFAFGPGGANGTTVVHLSITIDGTAGSVSEAHSHRWLCPVAWQSPLTLEEMRPQCKMEQCHVNGTQVDFPALASKTDCLGVLLRNTGALTSDLAVSYDAANDVLALEVDSEGVDATMHPC